MTSSEWKNRLLAIHRAHQAGDGEPLAILCGELAALEAMSQVVEVPAPDPEQPIRNALFELEPDILTGHVDDETNSEPL